MSTRTLPTLLAVALGAALVAPAVAQQDEFTLDRFDLDDFGDVPRGEPIMGEAPAFLEGFVEKPSAPAARPAMTPDIAEPGELPPTAFAPDPAEPSAPAALPPVAAATALPSVTDVDPSGSYTVASGQGMGHVAQALLAKIEEDGTVGRVPELWVPPAGGLIGLPHVVACYNRREPDDWSVNVGEVMALPPLHQVWTIIEHVKDHDSCPSEIQVPHKKVAIAEPAEGMEDFEFGGGFRVQLGRTYSHYGASARHYLAKFMPKDELPPLYPAPGRYGMLHLMACFNSGDVEALDIRAGQLLHVPPPIAISDARRYLEEHSGACPPDFRPAGSSPRGAVASVGEPISRGL
jgi:hypothetical protein